MNGKFIHHISSVTLSNIRTSCCATNPRHLICFKQWTSEMVQETICSAMNLKYQCGGDTHGKRLDVLKGCKITILQEINEPFLNLAVSKAATLLGGHDVTITDTVLWDHDYNGKVFSMMSDAIFVSTKTHMCVQRFSEKAVVPVLCMRSRTHASIQSLATIMAIMEHYGTILSLNIAYVGPASPLLNSYLLLCPMLGAHIRFMCCCEVKPVSPLLKKASEMLIESSCTVSRQCPKAFEALHDAHVIISGPTHKDPAKCSVFELDCNNIQKHCTASWIYFHSCPRGKEVNDDLFYHNKAKTFNALDNFQFIAAALMAYAVKGHRFG